VFALAARYRGFGRCFAGVAGLCVLIACSGSGTRDGVATQMLLLQLAPAALGTDLALQQRLVFRRETGEQQIDALLEVDANEVRLLLHQAGQSALRLYWDGSVLNESRADWLPAELSAARVLSDLQLTHWPLASIRAALPNGWRLQASAAQRALSYRGDIVVSIDYLDAQHSRLTQHRYGYVLEIESAEVAQ